MNKKRNTFFIAGSYLLLFLIIIILVITIKNYDRIHKIDAKQLRFIDLINNKTGQAEEITEQGDMESICHLFNTVAMHQIKSKQNGSKTDAENSFTFIFTTYALHTIKVEYYDGNYLINNGSVYSIHSRRFEKFWDLDYKKSNYTYAHMQ